MENLNVLMVGNSCSVKGGISSVINQLMSFNWEKNGIKMTFIPTYDGGSFYHKIIYFARAYHKIKRQIRFEKPNLVYIHMSYKGSFARKYIIHAYCKKKGIPDLVHLHGSEFKKWYDGANIKTKEKIRKLLQESASVIVLGESWERTIKEIEPHAKTIVLNNTVHIPDETCSWNEEVFQVLFLGVLIKRKGVNDLLQAAGTLNNSRKTLNIRYVIAGTGEEERALRDEVKNLDIEKLVEFKGWTSGEKKEELLRESQILVLPSYNEGLPIAVLEAISYGLPVIATDVGDISSAVKDGKNGYLISPGNVDQLAECILKINNNRELYLKMSEQSRTIAEIHFSDKRYFENIISCFRKVGGVIRRDKVCIYPIHAIVDLDIAA